MSVKSLAKSITISIPPLIIVAMALFAGFMLFQIVSLKPQVEPNFFFADDDPQYQIDLKIKQMFPEPEQIIVAAKGPIHSKRYQEKVKNLSVDLLGLPEGPSHSRRFRRLRRLSGDHVRRQARCIHRRIRIAQGRTGRRMVSAE